MGKDVKVYHKSDKMDWGTPQEFFDVCNRCWGPFDLDVCADESNYKVKRYFDLAEDGLTSDWFGVCWMNPPYGREIGKWMRKATEEVKAGRARSVVALVPSRTGSRWFNEYVWQNPVATGIGFLQGRLHFEGGGTTNAAGFDSAIIVYDNSDVKIIGAFEWKKHINDKE